MSLANTYRAKLVAKQNRQFWAYLGLAIAIHGVGAAGLVWGNLQQWLNFLNAETPKPQITPIDFVYVESEDETTPSPSSTNRRAQTNATAARNQSTAPVQPGKATAPNINIPASASTTPTSPATLSAAPPPIQTEPPQPTPLPSPLREPRSRVSESAPRPTAVPVVPPISASPTRPVSPTRQATTSSSPSTTPPSTSPSPATSPLGGPIARSLTIGDNGLRGQVNADRSGSGTSVDASRDDQWGTYLSGLNRLVDQNWQRVSVEATRRTKIQFRVDRQGRLTDLQLIQSSGDTLADQAALQAIRAAAPFAPLPQNTTEDVLIVNFTFTQWLQSDPP